MSPFPSPSTLTPIGSAFFSATKIDPRPSTSLRLYCHHLLQSAVLFLLHPISLLAGLLLTLVILASKESVLPADRIDHSLKFFCFKFSIGLPMYLVNNPDSFWCYMRPLWDLTRASLSKLSCCCFPCPSPLFAMLQPPNIHINIFKTLDSSLPHGSYTVLFPARSSHPHLKAR